jgi:hypothetical protein
MIPRLRHVSGYRVWLGFEDGREGEVDLEAELWGEVFEPLTQQDLFETVELNRELIRYAGGMVRTSLPSSFTIVSA